MAHEIVRTYTYGEDLAERTIVKFSAEGEVKAVSSPLDKPCGVTMFAGKKGAKGDVVLFGRTLVKTSGAVNAGDFLMADEDAKGCVINLNADDFVENEDTTFVAYSIGQVEESASGAAELWTLINIHPFVITKETETEEENTNQEESNDTITG